MGIISRNPKAAGGTEFSTGLILDDEVDADFNTAYNAINGNLDDANIKTAANIDPAKLGDASVNAAALAGVASPGSMGAESLPTTLAGELQRLRYAIGRNGFGGTGSNVKYYDGAEKNFAWFEQTARGPNLLRNGSFEAQSGGAGTAPDGWALALSPTTASLVAAVAANGAGRSLRIVTDSAGEGVTQTVAGLKASTRYLLVLRARIDVGTLLIVTTGGATTGTFRDIGRTATNATTEWIGSVVSTDSTPSSLVVTFVGLAPGADFTIDHAGLYELSTELHERPGYLSVSDTSDSTAGTLDTTRRAFPNDDPLTVSLSVPGPGYTLRVSAVCCFQDNVANAMAAALVEDDGGGGADVAVAHASCVPVGGGNVHLLYTNSAPTPGATYTYTVESRLATASGNPNGDLSGIATRSTLIAELIPPG